MSRTVVRAVGASKLRESQKLQLIIGGGSTPGNSDGIERDRIEGIINELGMNEITTLPGRLCQTVLPTYYAAADVCVVPSHYEPFGLVAIEAMASGTPVVASDVGGLQFTVVPEETGLLAPPQNVPAFTDAIDRILMSQQWRDELGKAARERVINKFSWDGVASALSELYTQSQRTLHSIIRTACSNIFGADVRTNLRKNCGATCGGIYQKTSFTELIIKRRLSSHPSKDTAGE